MALRLTDIGFSASLGYRASISAWTALGSPSLPSVSAASALILSRLPSKTLVRTEIYSLLTVAQVIPQCFDECRNDLLAALPGVELAKRGGPASAGPSGRRPGAIRPWSRRGPQGPLQPSP